jgi:hypothetical protein
MFFKKHPNFWIFFIFLILIFVFFGFTLNDFFVSDDFDWLAAAKNTKNVFSYFSTNYLGTRSGGTYSPFLNLLFYFEYNFWKLNPFGYHLTNLLFHLLTSFLVFLIGVELFKKKMPAFLAGLFFLIFPAHAEAVNWIAGRPHVIGTFFYLASLLSYLRFRKSKKLKFIFFALAAFILSLLTKELALTLPLVIIIFEFLNLKFKEFERGKNWQWFLIFLSICFVYFGVRYFATGILFGYYAQSNFILKISQIFKTFMSGLCGLFSWGSTRIFLTKLFLDCKILFLVLIFLLLVPFWLKRHKWQILSWGFLTSFILFAVTFGLILLLQFNPNSDEGERYLYLPSVGFCLLLGLLLQNINRLSLRETTQRRPLVPEEVAAPSLCRSTRNYVEKIVLIIFSLFIIFYFSFFLISKNLNWHEASKISKKIIDDFGRVVDISNQNAGLVFFLLPDNYEGAHVFRNGLTLALSFYYPTYHPVPVIFIPAYLNLDKTNKNDKIINWEMGKDRSYVFGLSKNGKWEITGVDRKETEDYFFELWGYNYENFTSNVIKLKIKKSLQDLMEKRKIYFLTYNEGGLQEFEWR